MKERNDENEGDKKKRIDCGNERDMKPGQEKRG